MTILEYQVTIEGDDLSEVECDNVLARATDYIAESLYDPNKEGPTVFFVRPS